MTATSPAGLHRTKTKWIHFPREGIAPEQSKINLIFQDQTQEHLAKALNGAGGKDDVVHGILEGQSDPYSVVKEIIESFAARDSE